MLLVDLFLQNSVKNLTRPAFLYLGKETAYGDLRKQISRLSYLYQNEVGQFARVAFLARNSAAYITTFFALSNNRAVTIPIDPSLPQEEIADWLKRTEATHIAVTGDLVGMTRQLLSRERIVIPIIEMERKQGGEYDTAFSPPPESHPIDTDVVLILRTAGSTGKPKPVAFTHKQLCHAGPALRGAYKVLPTDRFLTKLSWANPFAFVHGMLFPLLVGSTVVIDHGLESKEFVEFLRESRVTRLLGIPPFFLKLLIVCKNEKQPVPSFKSITVTQGNLSAELRKAFSLFKISVLQCYGMTENAWTISMQSLEVEPTADAEGSELELALGGRPLPGLKYKVLDDTGEEIEGTRERMGQLAVSGPTVMQGYRGLEKETKSAIRGTWLYTGDIVKLEGTGEDLRIHFIGRKDDLLIIDGEAVPLRRVDKALKGIVGVQDAASFVVNNSRGERLLVAAVVKIQNSALSEKQIKEQAGSKLPGHFVPQYIAFTDHIPRDAAGNVAYHRLRGQFSEIAG